MSTSILGQTVQMVAKVMGIKAVYTEHSLFNFGDHAGINLNKLIKWCMRDIDACIAVS